MKAAARLSVIGRHVSASTTDNKDISSYAKIHGEVSRDPATWMRITEIGGAALEEVIYEKTEEDIAKVPHVVSCIRTPRGSDARSRSIDQKNAMPLRRRQ